MYNAAPSASAPVFLSARWEHLLMLNYPADPAALAPLVPAGTELDTFGGTHYVSLVGFRFLDTRVKGVPIPFHRDFDEINLRFYVRRDAGSEVRRGVVFVREVVPKRMIATVARVLYGENYSAHPMRSTVEPPRGAEPGRVEYTWRSRGEWLGIGAGVVGEPAMPDDDSEQTFITEHYWGYSRTRSGATVEYRVKHPRWAVWDATDPTATGDFAAFYGPGFAEALSAPPSSAFVAVGSPVSVRDGRKIA